MGVDTSVVKKEYDRNPMRGIDEQAYPDSGVARSNKVRDTSQATRAGSEKCATGRQTLKLAREQLTVGTWNVRTMWATGKLDLLREVMKI